MNPIRRVSQAAHLLNRAVSTPSELSHMVYAVNNFCNNKCVMCNIWQIYRDQPDLLQQELSVQNLKEAFERSNYLKKIRFVVLTGGEPILKNDFVDIYLYLNEMNPQITIGIASNGRATGLTVNKLKAIRNGLEERGLGSKRIYIGYSLDGYAAVHDQVRGIPGLFENVLRTIEQTRALPKTEVALSFTIGPHNHKDFLKIVRLASELKIGLAYRCVQTSATYYHNESEKSVWTKEQLEELKEDLTYVEDQDNSQRSFLSRLINSTSYYNEMLLEYERNPRRLHECYSGSQSIFIDSYGNVFPCLIRNGSFGNITQGSFDDLWTSEKAAEIRRSIAAHECHCWVDCEVKPSLEWEPRIYLHNIKKILNT